ncbi:MAG: hypothetical protein HY962_08295 [Ignavibacteriae bacterium]|nr:hypothetical protein [Ignavibacteriota bacterium]
MFSIAIGFASHSTIAQMHIQSFVAPPASSGKTDLVSTHSELAFIDSIIGAETTDSVTKESMRVLKRRIEDANKASDLRDKAKKSTSPEFRQAMLAYADRLSGDTLTGLRVSGDIATKPAAQDGENMFTPVLTGDYHRSLDLGCSRVAELNVHLDLQAPAAGTTVENIANALLSGGGEGRLQVTGRIGFGEDLRLGVRFGLLGSLAWIGKKSASTTMTEALGFATCGFVFAAWLHPLIVIYQNEFGWVRGAEHEPLALLLNNSMVGNLLVGVQFGDGTYLQLKYPLAGNRDTNNPSNLEVRFVRTLATW